ncbi:MAG TPA: protein phosphatase 2C domain-containing protein [Steroidobacteraceae bacterium]
MLEDTLVEEDIHPVYRSMALTHAGRVRSNNQDAFVDRSGAGIWAVADGMGGHRDGDVASGLVRAAIEEMPGAGLDWNVEELQRRMSHVNSRLYAAALRPIDPVQSGSTVVAMLVQRTACAILWAGDSRVYRLRQERLVQLTRDHTWAAQMLPEYDDTHGEFTEEADHAITRAVGGEAALQLEIRRDRVQLGDRYLLCSDGLTHELPPAQIAALLAQGDVHQCAQALVDVTLRAGARDNVTVIVIDAN